MPLTCNPSLSGWPGCLRGAAVSRGAGPDVAWLAAPWPQPPATAATTTKARTLLIALCYQAGLKATEPL